jgi:hypothetical protein
MEKSVLPLVGIVNILETDILLILEKSIEFGMVPVETKLSQDERHICTDERCISYYASQYMVHKRFLV